MGRLKKTCGCDSSCSCGCNSGRKCSCESKDPCSSFKHSNFTDPINTSRRQYGRGRFTFATDIKSLLILIAEDDDENNRASLVLDACSEHCFIEDARIVAVMDNTVVIKDGNGCDGKFRFICINCICEVIVNCDVIMDELFEQHSLIRE